LTKLHPRVAEDDGDDDMPAEAGSFFNFFEIADDPFDVSVIWSLHIITLTSFHRLAQQSSTRFFLRLLIISWVM